eukprot:2771952-Rhodomonas_salina.6
MAGHTRCSTAVPGLRRSECVCAHTAESNPGSRRPGTACTELAVDMTALGNESALPLIALRRRAGQEKEGWRAQKSGVAKGEGGPRPSDLSPGVQSSNLAQ